MSLNKFSRRITQPKSQGASQAMLYGTGMTEADMHKAAGRHRQRLVRGQHLQHAPERRSPPRCKEGVIAAGMVGMRFNTIGVSDGISMGTEGMSYSLQSRDLIADSIETVMGGPVVRRQHLDPRLRQEHARLPDRHGPAQSAVADGLRRHDPGRPSHARRPTRSSTSSRPSSAMANTSRGTIDDDRPAGHRPA